MTQPDFCFLKTKKQTLKRFEVRLEGDTLNFLRQSKSSSKPDSAYNNSLIGAHITLDGQKTQCAETDEVFCSLALTLPTEGTRVIYFKFEQNRQEWYRRLLEAQGFNNEIDQYEITPKPLQKATNCEVLHAIHRASGKEVAIKVVDKTKTSQKLLSMFQGEAMILRRMNNKNVLKLIEVIETEEQLYIIMQFYRGGDL